MPAISAVAPGKVILFGEHAVVYGQPAIAVPLTQLQARTVITALPTGTPGEVIIQAPDIQLEGFLSSLPPNHPIVFTVTAVQGTLGLDKLPALKLRVSSRIPIASGLGSSAAVSVSVIRALSTFLGHPLPDKTVSSIAFEVEKIHHGTPSGIDNTVITYCQPVYFIKDKRLETIDLATPFTLCIADTGDPSPTAVAVGDVRKGWKSEPARYEGIFQKIGEISQQARIFIESGKLAKLGPLMDQNHQLLKNLSVSSSKLDRLAEAARSAGAWGAKMSGGGRGGNMVAIVSPDKANDVAAQLKAAGAQKIIITQVGR